MSSLALFTTKATESAFLASGLWCVKSDKAVVRQSVEQSLTLPAYPISNGHRNPEMGKGRPEE